MPRWKELPEDLDPQVREFAEHLRRLVERSGLTVSAVADRTGYSRSSWERYLGGRLLPPRGAVVALAEVTHTRPEHLTTMWEMAERAWSRAELRHDETMEALRVAEARAALGEFGPPPKTRQGRRGVRGYFGFAGRGNSDGNGNGDGNGDGSDSGDRDHDRDEAGGTAQEHRLERTEQPPPARERAPEPFPEPSPEPQDAPPPGPARPAPAVPEKRWPAQRVLLALVVVLLLGSSATGLGYVAYGWLGESGGGEAQVQQSQSPGTSSPSPSVERPAGVKCLGRECAGKDPEKMGCGGGYASSSSRTYLGAALLEVRVSEACKAAWARLINAGEGSTVTAIGAGPGAQEVREKAQAGTGGEGYTTMVVVDDLDAVRACANVVGGVQGCTKGRP